MILREYEVPVAYSMVRLAHESLGRQAHPAHVFTCYWTAFNNIYVTLTDRAGRRPQLRTNADGSVRMRIVGRVSVPEVRTIAEREQIDLAFGEFPDVLRRNLVEHENTSFFATRTPSLHGVPIATDGSGQRLNGVLNVGHTIDIHNPVWTPIDLEAFDRYRAGDKSPSLRDELAHEVLNVLYTVRNNAFHGGKRADDANDREVLERALPLQLLILESFMEIRRAA